MVKTLNIHLSCLCAYQSLLKYPSQIIPFSLLVLLQLTQGEGEEHGVPHPQLSATGAGPGAGAHLRSAVIMIIPRVNGAAVFTLPVYKLSKAIIMTRN